jgi:hypothetical protein
MQIEFQPQMDGTLSSLVFDHVVSSVYSNDLKTLLVSLKEKARITRWRNRL